MAEKLNIPDILKKLKLDVAPRPGYSELIMNCPDPACPNPKNHLYMNKYTGKFICHRCGIAGNIVTFVTILRGTNREKAEELLKLTKIAADTTTLREKLEELKMSDATASTLLTSKKLFNVIPPPRESIRVLPNRYPMYLNNRKVPIKLALAMKVRFCHSGKYAMRVIFPFTCAGNASFVAYATKEFQNPKTMNPPGSCNRDLIFGYDQMNKLARKSTAIPGIELERSEDLIVVEGIFDYLRMVEYGYHTMALLKSYLSKSQAILLNDCNFKNIIFMLDGDVTEDEYSHKLHHIRFIDSKQVFYAKIKQKHIDPDKLSGMAAKALILMAKKKNNDFDNLQKRLSKLKNF